MKEEAHEDQELRSKAGHENKPSINKTQGFRELDHQAGLNEVGSTKRSRTKIKRQAHQMQSS